MNPITIKNSFSKKDFLQLYLKRFYKKPLVVIFTALGGIQLVAIVIVYFLGNNEKILSFTPAFSALAIFLPLLGLLMAAQACREYQTNGTVEYIFTDEGISAKNSLVNWSYSWDKVIKIEDSGKFFFIFIHKKSADFIAKASLNQDQFLALKSLLNNKIAANNIVFIK